MGQAYGTSAYPNIVTIYCVGASRRHVHASGGQGLRPYDPGCSGMRAPRRGHPPHTKGDQTWPTWSRSYVQWGAPPGPGGAGPVGLGLRDGKHAPRKICGTVRPEGSNPLDLSRHSCPNAVPRHAVLTARRYPRAQLMAARESIAATTTANHRDAHGSVPARYADPRVCLVVRCRHRGYASCGGTGFGVTGAMAAGVRRRSRPAAAAPPHPTLAKTKVVKATPRH